MLNQRGERKTRRAKKCDVISTADTVVKHSGKKQASQLSGKRREI